MITKKEIKIALEDAYKKAGPNAYFGNGFEAGVKFALERVRILTGSEEEMREDLVKNLIMLGLDETYLDKEFSLSNGLYAKIISVDFKKRKYLIICETKDGRNWKLSVSHIKMMAN